MYNSDRSKGSICQSGSTVSSAYWSVSDIYRTSVCSMQCADSSCDDVETRLALCVAADGRTLYNLTDCESSSPGPDTSRACPSTSAPCDISPQWFKSSWNPVRLSSNFWAWTELTQMNELEHWVKVKSPEGFTGWMVVVLISVAKVLSQLARAIELCTIAIELW